MQKSAKLALIAVVVVILFGGAAFYWLVLRDTAPDVATIRDRTGETTARSAGATATADGTWKVAQDASTDATGAPNVFVGYRMMELFGGETVKKEAVGRTLGVTGTLTIEGQRVTAVDITADMTSLKSDQSRRDNYIKTNGLQTETFPTATFKTTQPIELPSKPKVNEKVTVQATGDLTVHGQTKTVTIPLDAVWTGSAIDVNGRLDLQIADFGIEKISIPIVTIDAAGSLEVKLSFVQQ
ncbi:MAG: YceI family protein [Actinobacteria bacterium]|nr:YceI family protein [Actinomycetota bacterium]